MSDRTEGGVVWTAVAAGLVVLCCAGPPLVLAIIGLGVGARLSAHGLWVLGGLALLVGAGAGLVAYRRSRAAPTGAVGERGAGRGGARP